MKGLVIAMKKFFSISPFQPVSPSKGALQAKDFILIGIINFDAKI